MRSTLFDFFNCLFALIGNFKQCLCVNIMVTIKDFNSRLKILFLEEGLYLVKFTFKIRSEEHTSELQSRPHLVCRLLLEKKKKKKKTQIIRSKKQTNKREKKKSRLRAPGNYDHDQQK